MKKIFMIISAALLLAGAGFFTGCKEGDEITQGLAGPKNTWCNMPVSYTNSDGGQTAALYAYFYYTDTDVSSTSTSATALKSGITIPAGLTIVITAAPSTGTDGVSSIINGLTSSAYIIKTFPKNSETTADTGDESYTFKGSLEKWSAIYWAKDDLRKSDNKSATPPYQLTNSGNGTALAWDNIKEQFSWKRLLANYLLSIL